MAAVRLLLSRSINSNPKYISTAKLSNLSRAAITVSKPASINKTEEFYEKTEKRSLLIQRTVESLQCSNPVNLRLNPNVSEVMINDPYEGLGTDSLSVFLYDRVPQIKYHNPQLKVICTRDSVNDGHVTVKYQNTEQVSIDVRSKDTDTILREFCELVSISENVTS